MQDHIKTNQEILLESISKDKDATSVVAAVGGDPEVYPFRLDQEENKSPLKDLKESDAIILPIFSGGKLDPYGGIGNRIKDLKKFEALSEFMIRPIFLTLTIDRTKFESPAYAYDHTSRWVSRLLSERLGISVWGRVIEPQTKTGDGWIHYHIIAELASTGFDNGTGFIDYKRLNQTVRHHWSDSWGFSGRGGIDVQPIRSKKGVAGYLSKYLVKSWPAIPGWILKRNMIRLVGFSKAANQLLRTAGKLAIRVKRKTKRKKKKKPIAPLLDRIAMSGLRCKVIKDNRFQGTLNAAILDVKVLAGTMVGLSNRRSIFKNEFSQKTTLVPILTGKIDQMNRLFKHGGLTERVTMEYERRLISLQSAWDQNQLPT